MNTGKLLKCEHCGKETNQLTGSLCSYCWNEIKNKPIKASNLVYDETPLLEQKDLEKISVRLSNNLDTAYITLKEIIEERNKQKELISDQEICIKNTLQSLNEWKEYAERLEELIDKIKEQISLYLDIAYSSEETFVRIEDLEYILRLMEEYESE